jgi:molybdate transport system substrate-binding protein
MSMSAKLVALIVLALLSACSRPQTSPEPAPLVVSVAASTIEVMEQLADEFHEQSGVEVTVNAGPSNTLATQILAGAPADVFLSASRQWADAVAEGGQAVEQVDLLGNRLVVVVPRGNPAGVETFEDLASPAVAKLALAGENVPAGMYADQALGKLGLLKALTDAGTIVRGQDVRAALGYVERGEAEAGIVYATDVRAAPGVETAFEIDPSLHEEIVYVLVLVKQDAANPSARKFYEFLQSDDANDVFAEFGFAPVSPAAAE